MSQRNPGGGQFNSLMDMIDGGGAGRAGQKFEGGGLLSDIANAFAKPRGYQDRLQAARPMPRPAMAQPPAPRPMPRPQPAQGPASGVLPQDSAPPVAPRQVMGSGMNPANAYVPSMPRPRAEKAADYIIQNFGPDVGDRVATMTPQERAELLKYLEGVGY